LRSKFVEEKEVSLCFALPEEEEGLDIEKVKDETARRIASTLG
jgi:hypothetical protein